ncbi:type II toxin-antitoxin system VapB family antitoxin [Glaciecola sp. 1036]|uniref:type II toxin-antitoxin system VapB family antitoxin n=1 Tax=Alteromonadaceae TaxID=72275 RepID=UPI003D01C3D2
MRTTVSIDDELFEKAAQFCDPTSDKASIIREAMQTFVRVQAAKRLASLAGKSPAIDDVPRRKD